jgi:hypothetical protein
MDLLGLFHELALALKAVGAASDEVAMPYSTSPWRRHRVNEGVRRLAAPRFMGLSSEFAARDSTCCGRALY